MGVTRATPMSTPSTVWLHSMAEIIQTIGLSVQRVVEWDDFQLWWARPRVAWLISYPVGFRQAISINERRRPSPSRPGLARSHNLAPGGAQLIISRLNWGLGNLYPAERLWRRLPSGVETFNILSSFSCPERSLPRFQILGLCPAAIIFSPPHFF